MALVWNCLDCVSVSRLCFFFFTSVVVAVMGGWGGALSAETAKRSDGGRVGLPFGLGRRVWS